MSLITLCEKGLVPDFLARAGMRRIIAQRLKAELDGSEQDLVNRFEMLIEDLKQSPIAIQAERANEQHYDLPPTFFEHVLGPRLKYSACLWADEAFSLADAEEAMLQLTCDRAQIEDGNSVLELGCGWGSLTLWVAEKYPNARITAISNSAAQRDYILAKATELNLENVEVIRADMNDFHTDKTFDRVVSVEMFEHMRNYQLLLSRIAGWLKPQGSLFVHMFCHDKVMYPFELRSNTDWMTQYYFEGGLMPAFRTLSEFQDHLILAQTWEIPGWHYERTLNAWLRRLDMANTAIMPLFETVYGKQQARIWVQRWRMFFMASAELFGFSEGQEWYIGHYRFTHP